MSIKNIAFLLFSSILLICSSVNAYNIDRLITTLSHINFSKYNHYYGLLHSHTAASDGKGTYDDAFKYARANGKVDFFAITEHSHMLDNHLNVDINNANISTKWIELMNKANKYTQNGKFVAIAGYEMTWSPKTDHVGHINTFCTEGYESRDNENINLKNYYDKLAKSPNSISQFNHPGEYFGDFNNFDYYSPEADKVITLLEVVNGTGRKTSGKNYTIAYDYYTKALDKGWHVAPVSNQDNHKKDWATANDIRTVIIASSLTKDNIFDSMRKMRVYSTEDKNLRIDYTINKNIMGSILENQKKLNISITTIDEDSYDNTKEISIISNNGKIVASKSFNSNIATWNLSLKPILGYYYVKVIQNDNDVAVTAPIWIK